MEPEENDGDDEKSEGDSIDYPTSEGDNDVNDDGDDLSKDDADDEDEEESSDSEEEEEEHLAPTIPAPALYSSVSESDETEPFEEGETVATPPPFGYRIAARISVQPHILMPFRSESEVERLLAIPTPPLSLVSLTSYTLPPLLTPLPIYSSLPTSSFLLPSSIPSTSGSESIPEADIPLRKRARFTTPTSRYEIGESFVAAAASRQIRPTLTIADKFLKLTENMRLRVRNNNGESEETKAFADWILSIGNGEVREDQEGEAEVEIPNGIIIKDISCDPIYAIINAIYPDDEVKDVNEDGFETDGDNEEPKLETTQKPKVETSSSSKICYYYILIVNDVKSSMAENVVKVELVEVKATPPQWKYRIADVDKDKGAPSVTSRNKKKVVVSRKDK
nr:ATP-dependent DNA helicase PIF1-like [Tanacetum cinerariifolium]